MNRLFFLPLLLTISTLRAQNDIAGKEVEGLASGMGKHSNGVQVKAGMASRTFADDDDRNEVFPIPNKAMLATVPAEPMNKGVMSGYLSNLYTAYKTKVPVAAVAAAQQAGIKLGNDPDKLGVAAVTNWYSGAPHEAILMAITASMKKPEDKLLLNNLGALLNLGGAHYHALPIFRTLVHTFPDNPMVLNNLGQSYAGVGELETAMFYFRKCIQVSPNHPEANNTAGHIEASRGNHEAAAKHFENSLKGGWNEGASKGMDKVAKERSFNLSRFIKPPVNLPYFNEYKFKLPRQCQTAADAPAVRQAHDDFWNFMEAQSSMYAALSRSAHKKGEEKMERMLRNALQNRSMPNLVNPLQIAAGRKLMYFGIGLQAETEEHLERVKAKEAVVQALLQNYEQKRKAILDDYAQQKGQYTCGEGNGAGCAAIERLNKEECKAIVAMSAVMQQQIAAAVVDKQQEELRFARRVFENFAYWSYLAAPNKEMAEGEYYKICAQYLQDVKRIAAKPIIVAGICGEQNEAVSKPESEEAKAMQCPIDLTLPFVIGKIELNCEKFSFSAGEGVTFKYEKDFGSKQSTISIGAGLQLEAGKAFGIFSGELGASAEQSFYIVFDGDNNITDAGLAMQVEVSVGAEVGIDTPGGVGKEYLSREILDSKGEFGYTLGVNSGWTFNDGAISSIAKSLGGIFKK
jgi:tetratricopeptide (TPR) repeat protein